MHQLLNHGNPIVRKVSKVDRTYISLVLRHRVSVNNVNHLEINKLFVLL